MARVKAWLPIAVIMALLIGCCVLSLYGKR
jgi:hypothetical protein